MKKSILSHGDPKVLEAKRIVEIKALSYLQRLERLMTMLELSYKLRTAEKIQVKKP